MSYRLKVFAGSSPQEVEPVVVNAPLSEEPTNIIEIASADAPLSKEPTNPVETTPVDSSSKANSEEPANTIEAAPADSPSKIISEKPTITFERDPAESPSKTKVSIAVRIQDYQGENSTSEYFTKYPEQQFSIQLLVTFGEDVNGDDLLWGNDFDKPIRDILPYGFSIGYQIMKRCIDPSIDGDAYADEPFLYGKVLSSMSYVRVEEDEWPGLLDSDDIRVEDVPQDPLDRSKYFLIENNRKEFTFKAGNTHAFEFSTKYITLGKQFAIKLPGYNLNVERYCGSQPLRYTLKNKKSGQVYAMVVFDLQTV
ncbi:hypothetical protein TRVA0_028S01398 [Trichomonascus vanleenenianus]|uniref:DUF1769 domain-containing protein n=1 Tax=Trichomonascus vanleenenianus TaxID=2268995 RepID=UPI003ECB8AC1